MVVVNGPIRKEIGMNWGIGAMGPYNHANATIGRAYGLLSQNLQGGSMPGVTFMGSQGNNYTYNNLTFAENEERSPWEPLHVQKGFKPTDSAVSVFYGCRSTTFCLGLREKYWREHVRDMLAGIDAQLGAVPAARSDHGAPVHRPRRLRHQGEADPLHPRDRADAGRPLLGPAARAELRLSRARPSARSRWRPGSRPATDELIRIFPEEDINVVVVGGEANGYWRIMGAKYRKTVSVDAWR